MKKVLKPWCQVYCLLLTIIYQQSLQAVKTERSRLAYAGSTTNVCSNSLNFYMLGNYAPNFEKVEGAYCFGLVGPSKQKFS